jgi:phenylacetic acid degradation operon negative regulatory protein
VRHDGTPGYQLSIKAVHRLDEAASRIYRTAQPPWGGQFDLIVLEPPESRAARARLTATLAYLGYGSLDGATWSRHAAPTRWSGCSATLASHMTASPRRTPPASPARPPWSGGPGTWPRWRRRMSSSSPTRPPPCWTTRWRIRPTPPARGANSGQAAHVVSGRPAGVVSRAPTQLGSRDGQGVRPSADELAYAARFRLVHAWRSFLFRDPQLPPALLPSPWPGQAAAEFFDHHEARLRPAADRFVDRSLSA